MSPLQNFKHQQRGFSLVEIMVGMVISLLSMIIILQVFSAFEGQKRTSTSGSDAQTNGAVALFTIERDVRNAGYGLSIPEALGCKINSSYNGTPLPTMTLQPVVITNGAGGLPDTIEMLASGKGSWSIPTKIVDDHTEVATNVFISSSLGMEVNDIMIAFEPGKDCTVFQITGIPPGNVQVHHQNTSPWNPPGGSNIFPTGGYNIGAMLFNLGQMIRHTYSLDDDTNDLLFTEFLSASGVPATPVALIPDIVNLQAQYGFDTRAGVQTDAQVDTWADTLINADNADSDGDGNNANDPGDIARIFAIRLALVARSGQQEKADATSGSCNTTTTKPKFFNTTTDIEISKNPDGSTNANWRCYRYKTFETIIPLRNLIWRQT